MKNFFKLFGIIALMVIIGIGLMGCDNGSTTDPTTPGSEAPPPSKTLMSISVKTPPTKTTYTVGDTADYTGLVITATYSDASTGDILYAAGNTNFSFSGFNSAAFAVSKTITVTYSGKTATFTISVTADYTKEDICDFDMYWIEPNRVYDVTFTDTSLTFEIANTSVVVLVINSLTWEKVPYTGSATNILGGYKISGTVSQRYSDSIPAATVPAVGQPYTLTFYINADKTRLFWKGFDGTAPGDSGSYDYFKKF